MKGKVLFYDTTGKEGLLEGEDGSYYEFNSHSLKNSHIPLKGESVEFDPVVVQNTYLADLIKKD